MKRGKAFKEFQEMYSWGTKYQNPLTVFGKYPKGKRISGRQYS